MSAEDDGSALEAARTVATEHGVACDEAAVIASRSNVLVHLRPAPVVARVMTGTAVLHDDVRQWLEREVAVTAFAAGLGAPVVPPSDALPPGPHLKDGLWMTFSTFIAEDTSGPAPTGRDFGLALLDLHTVLAKFPQELDPVSATGVEVGRMIGDLRPVDWLTQSDIDSFGDELSRLTPIVFETSLPIQALHGDTSMSNVLITAGGLRWNDFEDVCAGPVAWDVVGLVQSATGSGQGAGFVEELLEAYGDTGVDSLEPFASAHDLYAIVWQIFDAQRRDKPRQRAEASLARWRSRPSP